MNSKNKVERLVGSFAQQDIFWTMASITQEEISMPVFHHVAFSIGVNYADVETSTRTLKNMLHETNKKNSQI